LTLTDDDAIVVVSRAESERSWSIENGLEERDNRVLNLMTERYERRLVEECAKIRVELAGARADFIKWSFLFWIGQAATVAALFVALR